MADKRDRKDTMSETDHGRTNRNEGSEEKPVFHRALVQRMLWSGILLAIVVVGFTFWGSQLRPEPVTVKPELTPGLGLATLHQDGYNGQGVGIAIVDTWLFKEHEVFIDRIAHYEELGVVKANESHGTAVASVAVGAQIGVAPSADLYYFAVPTAEGIQAYVDGLERVRSYNEENDNPIAIVSVSTGFAQEYADSHWFYEAIEQLRVQGTLVLTSTMPTLTNPPWALREAETESDGNFDSVDDFVLLSGLDAYLRESDQSVQDLLEDRTARDRENGYVTAYLPAARRYTAAISGPDRYDWEEEGGLSLATPYLAGLAALILQRLPSAGPEEVMGILTESIVVNQHGLPIPDPSRFPELIESFSDDQ